MFDHVTIRVSDREQSARFYDTVLPVVGLERTGDEHYFEWDEFSIAPAHARNPVTRRLHIAFYATTHDLVDEFWRVGTAAGYPSDGEPGPRPQYGPEYYGSFLLDPDGNSVEAVFLGDDLPNGTIDHLWLRTRDVPAAKRFYEAVAPHAGFRVNRDLPERVQLAWERGRSFSFLEGEPTENVHLAFAAASNDAVDEFHRALTEAGYRDNGEPGERPVYHDGYYGAFVLDPDGHNVELVNHNR